MITTLLEIIGFALIAVGFGIAWLPLGLIVGGASLAGLAYLADRGVKQ